MVAARVLYERFRQPIAEFAFVALNFGIALATLFRFWSYRQFVWGTPPAARPPKAERPRPVGGASLTVDRGKA